MNPDIDLHVMESVLILGDLVTPPTEWNTVVWLPYPPEFSRTAQSIARDSRNLPGKMVLMGNS